MTAAFEPSELIAAALSALFFAVPIAVAVAAGVLAVPRRRVSAPGLGLGIGLLAGMVLAIVGIAVGPSPLLQGGTALLLALGLLCVMAAAVLILLRREPALADAVVGTVGCVLIGLGEPSQLLPAMFAMSSSALVAVAALVIEAVVIVGLSAVLALLGARLAAVRLGVAVAALAAGVMVLWGVVASGAGQLIDVRLPTVPLLAMLIIVGVAFVVGTIVGAVLGPRGPQQAADSLGQSTDRLAPPA